MGGGSEIERERERERERLMDRKRKHEGGSMQCFMKKEDKSLIDVKNIETTYFDNYAFFAAMASFLLQFCIIHLSLASLTFCATYSTFHSGVFIGLSCRRYPSQHRYDFCAQRERQKESEKQRERQRERESE